MPTMRAMVVQEAQGLLEAEERDLPDPGGREMRLRVEACGVCHTDAMMIEGLWAGIQSTYPRP